MVMVKQNQTNVALPYINYFEKPTFPLDHSTILYLTKSSVEKLNDILNERSVPWY